MKESKVTPCELNFMLFKGCVSKALCEQHRLRWIRIFKLSEYWRGSNLGSAGFRRSEVKNNPVLTHCRCKDYIQRCRPSYWEPKSRKFVVLN